MTLHAASPTSSASRSTLTHPSHRAADRDREPCNQTWVPSNTCLPALRRLAGPRLHVILGTRCKRQADDSMALCQLRRLRGLRHPGQPREGLWVGTGGDTTTGRASMHRMAARRVCGGSTGDRPFNWSVSIVRSPPSR
jgi:hypothetical protein